MHTFAKRVLILFLGGIMGNYIGKWTAHCTNKKNRIAATNKRTITVSVDVLTDKPRQCLARIQYNYATALFANGILYVYNTYVPFKSQERSIVAQFDLKK